LKGHKKSRRTRRRFSHMVVLVVVVVAICGNNLRFFRKVSCGEQLEDDQ
jgi:putative copper export protein